jgi:hypothetical protein
MKTGRWIVFSLASFFCAGTVFSAPAGLVVLPKKDSVAVYQNEQRHFSETPLFRASLDDRLMVIKNGSNRYLVKDRDGRQGWIDKKECVRVPPRAALILDSIVVPGSSGDLNGFAFVDGKPDQQDNRLFIDRSFKGELVSNLDLDEMEKRAGK